MTSIRLAITHRYNCLHVYCRLIGIGVNKRVAICIARIYELAVHRLLYY
jgi:hypothetical protein